MAVMFICPARDGHHVGQLCPVCGQDERHLGARVNPEWQGYTLHEFLERWKIRVRLRAGWAHGIEARFERGNPIPDTERGWATVTWFATPFPDTPEGAIVEWFHRQPDDCREFLGPLAWSEFTTEVRL